MLADFPGAHVCQMNRAEFSRGVFDVGRKGLYYSALGAGEDNYDKTAREILRVM